MDVDGRKKALQEFQLPLQKVCGKAAELYRALGIEKSKTTFDSRLTTPPYYFGIGVVPLEAQAILEKLVTDAGITLFHEADPQGKKFCFAYEGLTTQKLETLAKAIEVAAKNPKAVPASLPQATSQSPTPAKPAASIAEPVLAPDEPTYEQMLTSIAEAVDGISEGGDKVAFLRAMIHVAFKSKVLEQPEKDAVLTNLSRIIKAMESPAAAAS